MAKCLRDAIHHFATVAPSKAAVLHGTRRVTYEQFLLSVDSYTDYFLSIVKRHERVAIFLDKKPETIFAILGGIQAGAILVPINPVLKAAQVVRIIDDARAKFLLTSDRVFNRALLDIQISSFRKDIVEISDDVESLNLFHITKDFGGAEQTGDGLASLAKHGPAMIVYTSGSTGDPMGVVLSQDNILFGAECVNEYLGHDENDVILSVLPLSFDAGFSQITTSILAGATVVLHEFFLPDHIPRLCTDHRITSITAVPSFWSRVANLSWPEEARHSMRLFASTGSTMPTAVLDRLRQIFPNARPFLMYGFTEAFRSTYLDPLEVNDRPTSIGKAIPGCIISVISETGLPCQPYERGELVQSGRLVTLGYWNRPEATAIKFRPLPDSTSSPAVNERSAWSGDLVYFDEDGFLYFEGRRDDMIKASGYRVYPIEIERAIIETGLVNEVAVLAVRDGQNEQKIVGCIVPRAGEYSEARLLRACQEKLPNYIVPTEFVEMARLPHNANGKVDRMSLHKFMSIRQ